MKAAFAPNIVQPLRFLPRDKKLLDFILNKLAINSSPARFDILQELFEMYRTSVGFDPNTLTKGRFKRFKSAEIRIVLAELENDISIILCSDEYLKLSDGALSHADLTEQYSILCNMITAPSTRELNEQVDKFIKLLEQEGAYELLLSFYRQAYNHFLQRAGGLEQVVTSYNLLLGKLDFQNAFVLSGFQTSQLLNTTSLNPSQESLLLHFNSLINLLERSRSHSSRFELLGRIFRIGLMLERRIMHLSPFITIPDAELEEMKSLPPALRYELLAVSLSYNNEIENGIKLNKLEALEAEAKSTLPTSLMIIKSGKALVQAHSNNFEDAIRTLNESEHLLFRNGFGSNEMKKIWIQNNFLRFFIYITNEVQNDVIYEDETYDIIIQTLADLTSNMPGMSGTISGLKGIKKLIKNNLEQADYFLKDLCESGTPQPLFYVSKIFDYFCVLNSHKDRKKLSTIIDEIAALNEPFYSTVMVDLLKKLSTNNTIN